MTFFWDRYFLVMFHEMTQICNKIWRASQNYCLHKVYILEKYEKYEIFYAALHCEQMMSNCLLDLIFLAPFNSSPIIISFKLFPKSWEAYYHRQIFDRKWNWLNIVLEYFSSETIISAMLSELNTIHPSRGFHGGSPGLLGHQYNMECSVLIEYPNFHSSSLSLRALYLPGENTGPGQNTQIFLF